MVSDVDIAARSILPFSQLQLQHNTLPVVAIFSHQPYLLHVEMLHLAVACSNGIAPMNAAASESITCLWLYLRLRWPSVEDCSIPFLFSAPQRESYLLMLLSPCMRSRCSLPLFPCALTVHSSTMPCPLIDCSYCLRSYSLPFFPFPCLALDGASPLDLLLPLPIIPSF